tara:strand:- start:5660 stop:6097 length:438 start_codon:yes stop_codon:yes gene_type:complete
MINSGYDNRMVSLFNNLNLDNYDERCKVGYAIMNKYKPIKVVKETIIPPEEAVAYVHNLFKVKPNPKSRANGRPQIRAGASYILELQHSLGISEIGRIQGFNHATIYHHLNRTSDKNLKYDRKISRYIKKIKDSLNIKRELDYSK